MPASPAQIGVAFERLALHFPRLNRTQQEAKWAIHDWLEDLAEYPEDLILEACRQWRTGATKADARFPTPGQLIAPVKPILEHRKRLGRRAMDFLAVAA